MAGPVKFASRFISEPAIQAAMLFVQGTRDAFARNDLIDGLMRKLGPAATLVRIEGGDHSFAVPRSAGRSKHDVEKEIIEAVVAWLAEKGL